MRIKNVGRSTIIFNGGSLEAGKVAVFKDDAEKIGKVLLATYPDRLEDLDNIKKEDVVNIVIGDELPVKKKSKSAKK